MIRHYERANPRPGINIILVSHTPVGSNTRALHDGTIITRTSNVVYTWKVQKMTTMAKSAANRANTKPVTRSNICTWPDPGALSSTRTGFYGDIGSGVGNVRVSKKEGCTHGSTHGELQVDSSWLADPVNERLSFTSKQRAETIKIPRWSFSRLYFFFLTIERRREERRETT